MLSGRYLCEELITRPEESYRLWCVVVSDLETSSYTLYRYWIGVSGQIDALTANPKVCQRVDIDPLAQGDMTALVGTPTSNLLVPTVGLALF